jgi:UDP-N-acetylmuramoyl-tripeptide--D-alanyl-D-alanine ligase
LSDIAAEKASLLWSVGEQGSVVCFADEPVLLEQLGRVRAQRQWMFGAREQADVRLAKHAVVIASDGSLGMRCDFAVRTEVGRAASAVVADMRLMGPGPALDAAAALAVVIAERGEAALSAAAQGLAQVEPVAGRLSPLPGPLGSILLDDSYNANSASMAVSIAAACELATARSGRVWLVLGDMLELGALSQAEHAAVGRAAARPEVSALITVGAEMAAAAQAARETAARLGLSLTIARAEDTKRAAALVLERLSPADVVLVKGSRGMRMERVLDELLPQRGPAATSGVAGGAA